MKFYFFLKKAAMFFDPVAAFARAFSLLDVVLAGAWK